MSAVLCASACRTSDSEEIVDRVGPLRRRRLGARRVGACRRRTVDVWDSGGRGFVSADNDLSLEVDVVVVGGGGAPGTEDDVGRH